MKNTKKVNDKKFFILCLALLLLVMGFRFGNSVFDYLKQKKESGISVTQAGYLVEKAGKIIGSADSEKTKNVTIAGYGNATAAEGSCSAELFLINPEENKDLFYLQFQLILDDTKEVLYTSDLLEPGKEITRVDLKHSFNEGEYKLNVLITPVMMENPEVSCNQASYNMKLIVEK